VYLITSLAVEAVELTLLAQAVLLVQVVVVLVALLQQAQ